MRRLANEEQALETKNDMPRLDKKDSRAGFDRTNIKKSPRRQSFFSQVRFQKESTTNQPTPAILTLPTRLLPPWYEPNTAPNSRSSASARSPAPPEHPQHALSQNTLSNFEGQPARNGSRQTGAVCGLAAGPCMEVQEKGPG